MGSKSFQHISPDPRISTSPVSLSNSMYHIFASFCTRELRQDNPVCNWIESYRPSSNTWTRVSPIMGLTPNHVLKDFAMVSIKDSIFIIGGRECRKVTRVSPSDVASSTSETNLSPPCEVDVRVRSSVLRYDISTGQWSHCTSLNKPRYNFACTVLNERIYVAGGLSDLSCARGTSCAEVYNPSEDKWTELPNMSTLRYKCVGVTWQGKVYVVGGFVNWKLDMDGKFNHVVRCSVETYDPCTQKWELVAGMWQLDVPPNQIVQVEGTLFSSGDCLNAWKGHIDSYDGKLKIWNIVDGSQIQINPSNSSDCSTQRMYMTMAPIGTRLYFLAGYRMADEALRNVSLTYVFDTSVQGGAWSKLEPVEEEGEKELCSHCCVLTLMNQSDP